VTRVGQSTVEYMLVVSVIVIALVAVGYGLTPDIVEALTELGEEAETVYTDASIAN